MRQKQVATKYWELDSVRDVKVEQKSYTAGYYDILIMCLLYCSTVLTMTMFSQHCSTLACVRQVLVLL